MLKVRGLIAKAEGATILRGVDLHVDSSEVVAVMGPNGSGKTTLARAILGDPQLETGGEVLFNGEPLGDEPPEERFRRGIFGSFQHPPGIEGVRSRYFLKTALGADDGQLEGLARELGLDAHLLSKDLNAGFSGGERKKMEVLQALLADPQLLVLDEVDSGLDMDAVREVDGLLERFRSGGKGVLVITHYTRIFQSIKPDRIYVLVDGRVVEEGGPGLLDELEASGFEGWR